MSSWTQVPFSGAPPIPSGFNIPPNLWQAGQWIQNPKFNWNSLTSHLPQSWAPSTTWGRFAGMSSAGAAAGGTSASGQAAGARPAQTASRNPFKRVPKEPSAEYLAQPLSGNPLGLMDMVPREQLYGPGVDGALPETPWIWNPRGLEEEEESEEEDTDSGSGSPSPSPSSHYRSPERRTSEGLVPPPHSARQSSHTPPERRASEGLVHPTPVVAQNEPQQPLQLTFSSRIVRTPDHYRQSSSGSGSSLSRSNTMPSIDFQLSGMEQLTIPSRRSSTSSTTPPSRQSSVSSSAPPSRQSSVSSTTTTASSTSTASMTGLNVISDEPMDLLSPLVIDTPLPAAPKALSRNHSAPAAGGHGHSSLTAIPEGGLSSASDHTRKRSKRGHKSEPSHTSTHASVRPSSVTPTPLDPNPHSTSRSHSTPTTGTTSASQYASNYASTRSQTAPSTSASNQSNGQYTSASNYASNYSSYQSQSVHPSSSASAQAAQTQSIPSKNAGSSHTVTNYSTYRSQTAPTSSSTSAYHQSSSNPPAGSSYTTYRSHTAPTATSSSNMSASVSASYSNQAAASTQKSSYKHPPEPPELHVSHNPLPKPPKIIEASTYMGAFSSASANAAAASSNAPATSSASASANKSTTTSATANNNHTSYTYRKDDDKTSYNNHLPSPLVHASGQKPNTSYPFIPSYSSTSATPAYPATPSNQVYTPYTPHTPHTPATPGSHHSSRSSYSSPSALSTRSSVVSTLSTSASSGSGSGSASASSASPLPTSPLPPSQNIKSPSRPPPLPIPHPSQASQPIRSASHPSVPSSQPPAQASKSSSLPPYSPPHSASSSKSSGTYILPGRETYVPLPAPPPQAVEISRKRMQEEAMRKAEAAQLASPPGTTNPNVPRHRVRKGYWNRRGDHYIDGYIVYAPLQNVFPLELGTYPGEFEGYKDEHGRFVAFVTGRPELPDSLPNRGCPPVKPYDFFVRYVD